MAIPQEKSDTDSIVSDSRPRIAVGEIPRKIPSFDRRFFRNENTETLSEFDSVHALLLSYFYLFSALRDAALVIDL